MRTLRFTDGAADATHGEHLVHFYDDEAVLARGVAAFLATGLDEGDAAVVIATAAHGGAIRSALGDAGVDVPAVVGGRQLVFADAAVTLPALARECGQGDVDRFEAAVTPLLEQARGAPGVARLEAPAERSLRVYGDMAACVGSGHDVGAALALERCLNGLAERRTLLFYCGYPVDAVDAVDGAGPAASLDRACREHSDVVASGTLAERSSSRRCFEPSLGAVADARRFVSGVLAEHGLSHLSDVGVLVVSELATNAVVHARSPFTVTASPLATTVRLAVGDRSPEIPTGRFPAPSTPRESGRGLLIVEALCTRWGVHRRRDGKDVWAELRTSP